MVILSAQNTGRPLLLLEDLIVALRAIDGARMGGMRCSIDPTPEGVARLQKVLTSTKQVTNPQQMFPGNGRGPGATANNRGWSAS